MEERYIYSLTLYHTIPTFDDPNEEGFGKQCGKGENAGHQHFPLFPNYFYSIKERNRHFNNV